VGQSPARGKDAVHSGLFGNRRTVDAMAFFRGISKFVAKVSRADDFWPTFEHGVIEAPAAQDRRSYCFTFDLEPEVTPMPEDFAGLIHASTRPIPIGHLGSDRQHPSPRRISEVVAS
jgi:hypothetical protein